jgi:hypothetical protein
MSSTIASGVVSDIGSDCVVFGAGIRRVSRSGTLMSDGPADGTG